jgi:hypothetical protein
MKHTAGINQPSVVLFVMIASKTTGSTSNATLMPAMLLYHQ